MPHNGSAMAHPMHAENSPSMIAASGNSTPPSSSLDQNLSPVHNQSISPMQYPMHSQSSPPIVSASVSGNTSPPSTNLEQNLSPAHQHHSISMQYAHQIPSPVHPNTPTNLIVANNLNQNNKYMQPYIVHHPHHPSNIDASIYSQSQAMMTPSYSPTQSPKSLYYVANMMSEHDIKSENLHLQHSHHSHHHQHQMQDHMHQQMQHGPSHNLSRSPSEDDEHDSGAEQNYHELQSQIIARNSERPTVVNAVNIKIE